MAELIVTDGLVYTASALIQQFPVLQYMADLTARSLLLLLVFLVVYAIAGRRLSDAGRHLLWLNSLICLALLPVIPLLQALWQQWWPGYANDAAPSALFELPVFASHAAHSFNINWGWLAIVLYMIPVAVLTVRLLMAVRSLKRLHQESVPVNDAAMLQKLTALRLQLGISRRVSLRSSGRVESPVSYGVFNPQIVLPPQATDWQAAMLTDVLLHELCHIRRLDWLTTLFGYCVAALYWINPLVWQVFKRLRDESENSCDSAVLNSGRSDTGYAQSLLNVASSCIQSRRHRGTRQRSDGRDCNTVPFAQSMLDQNSLKNRIRRVLGENRMSASETKKQLGRSVIALLVLSVATLGALGSHSLLHAQSQAGARAIDEEMIPLTTIEPVYPRAAADAGIEGWAHVRFTVSADGTVAEGSVSIVEAEPAQIFDASAIAATRQFTFSPRVVAGQAVDVPNVQYVFRYYLSEASERAAQQAQ